MRGICCLVGSAILMAPLSLLSGCDGGGDMKPGMPAEVKNPPISEMPGKKEMDEKLKKQGKIK